MLTQSQLAEKKIRRFFKKRKVLTEFMAQNIYHGRNVTYSCNPGTCEGGSDLNLWPNVDGVMSHQPLHYHVPHGEILSTRISLCVP